MADGVIVEGFGPGVNQWATETTTADILKTLVKLHKLTEEQAKALKDLGKSGSGGGSQSISDMEKALKDLERETREQADVTEDTTKKTKDFGDTLISVAKNVAGGIISAVGTFAGALTNQLGMMLEINQAGMNLVSSVDGVASGLGTFSNAAMTANLSFKELNEIQKKYGNTLNVYGVQKFAAASKTFSDKMVSLGATSEESAEFLADYLDLNRQVQLTNSQNLAKQTQQSMTLFENFDGMSKVLGISKQQMLDNVAASIKASTATSFYLQSAGEGVNNAFMNLGSVVSGPETEQLRNALFDLGSEMFTARSELFNAFAGTSAGAAQSFEKFRLEMQSGAAVSKNTSIDVLKKIANANEDVLRIMNPADSAQAKVWKMQAMLTLKNMEEEEKFNKMGLDDRKTYYEQQLKSAASFSNAWKQITSVFERIIGGLFENGPFVKAISAFLAELSKTAEDTMPDITKALTSILLNLTPWIGKIAEWIKSFNDTVEKTKDFDVVEMIKGKLTEFTDYLSSELVWDIGKAIAVGLAGGAVAAMAGKFIFGSLGKLFEKIGGPAPGPGEGPGGGGALGSLGRGIGGLGGGIISGLLGGIATGLIAFSDPLVAAGALGFGFAIAAIGAGLATATWLMGGALPTFAEGMRSFETLDADKLVAVGSAIQAIGTGIAAMGAGSVLDTVGSIGSTVAGWFTDDDSSIVDKFSAFEDIDTGKIIDSAIAMSILSESLTDLAAAITSLNNVSAVTVDANSTVSIGEKSIVQLDNITAPVSPGSKNTANMKDLPNPVKAEKINEISTLQELDIMKKQLRFLANIAANSELQVKYLKKTAEFDPTKPEVDRHA